VLVRLTPSRFRLRLDTDRGIEHRDSTVDDPQRTFHFHQEVNVAWGVDDVDEVIVPEAGGSRRGYGDAPLLVLFRQVRKHGVLTDLRSLAASGIEKDTLGRGRTTGIDVSHDADVAVPIERCGA